MNMMTKHACVNQDITEFWRHYDIHKYVNINIIANICRIWLVKLQKIQLSIHTKVINELIIKELSNYRMQAMVNELTVSTRVEQ